MLPVIEQFISLDGEGPTAGELAYFVRFQSCNLRCSWCDTVYSWDDSINIQWKSAQQIYDEIKESGIRNVTLTGGEPLIQEGIIELLQMLQADADLLIHIETNGSIDILSFRQACPAENIIFILDYKLPASGMEQQMQLDNLEHVTEKDVYKFVIASQEDLERAIALVQQYELQNHCQIYFSPVWGQIEPLTIVDAMKNHCLNKVRLQLQLHKILWPKEMRGV